MIIEKNYQGAWVIRETINGFLETLVYFFYTKKEAIKLFRKFRKEKKNEKTDYR